MRSEGEEERRVRRALPLSGPASSSLPVVVPQQDAWPSSSGTTKRVLSGKGAGSGGAGEWGVGRDGDLEGNGGVGVRSRKRRSWRSLCGGRAGLSCCPPSGTCMPTSICSEGRLNCTDLPCPGMCPAQREGRRSGQCGRDDWAWGRDSCAPVPTIVPCSAWQLVPMVGVESMLPALQEPDEDLLQGLCLSCTSTGWGPLLPLLQGGRAGWHPASEGDLPQPHPVPR